MAGHDGSTSTAPAGAENWQSVDLPDIPEVRAIYARSQHLLEDLYVELEADTEFASPRVKAWTPIGRRELPPSPPDDKNVTRKPVITAMTEAFALAHARRAHPNVKVPFARVEHQEWTTVQHHGIDFIGYDLNEGKMRVWIFEVMATVQASAPRKTVSDHYDQLYNTVHPRPWGRLKKDLRGLLNELPDSPERTAIRSILTALEKEDIVGLATAQGWPILVHQQGGPHTKDWKPFEGKASAFLSAHLPTTVSCCTLELPKSYVATFELLNRNEDEEK